MITGDNPLTAAAIAREAGVDDFLAQATPKDKMDLIRREQADGKLVAMTGDGTNDAPALAQADVGVAMNTGTQAAKEAGNMVDLDSNPTKLIEIVEIGKQLLMTRGALTTFSIANDVAKYFAIIPAMFAGTFPVLNALNIMHLKTPQSAILSAVIFNALIIVALIPLALRGVKYRAMGAAALLRNNLLIYGVGGIIVPFIGIKLIDMVITRHRDGLGNFRFQIWISDLRAQEHTVRLKEKHHEKESSDFRTDDSRHDRVAGPGLSPGGHGAGAAFLSRKANGQLVQRNGTVVASRIIAQPLWARDIFIRVRLRPDNGYDATSSAGTNLGPTNQKLIDRVNADVASAQAENPGKPVPADMVTTSASGLDPRHHPASAEFQVPRIAKARGMSEDAVRAIVANTPRAGNGASSVSRASTCWN